MAPDDPIELQSGPGSFRKTVAGLKAMQMSAA
jgi:hypothetical protein